MSHSVKIDVWIFLVLFSQVESWTGILNGTGSSRAREFHPHPLTEPCVKVSPHTALHTLCFVHMLLSSYPPLCLIVVQFQLLECVTPFAPCPLQTLQRYYGAIRHRRGLRYISALFVTFGISLGIPTSAFHVPPNEPVLLSCHLYAACHNAIDRLLHCLSPELSDTDFWHDLNQD